MAEQERKTFKWGDLEYLLDDLLKLHAEQENNYYNFARDKGQYDDTALAGLRSAITSRINAAKSGSAFAGDGVLDTDRVDNTSIQTQKKGLFKKEKYVDQDNTEWAKYYMNKLVGLLKPHQKEAVKDTGAWDMAKYGFGAYLTGLGLNAKDFFEQYDKKDPNNPDNPRVFTQRDAELRKHLEGYRTWLQGKGFDFTKNDNEWDDSHMSTVEGMINNADWNDRAALAANLRKIGSGDDYTTAFTSDRWDLSKSNDDMATDAKKAEAAKKTRENTEAYNSAVGNYYGIYSGLSPRTGQMTAYLGQSNSSFYRTPEELLDWSKTNKATVDSYRKRYDENKWDAEAAQYILPMMQTNGRLMEATIDGTKYVYDPSTIDRTTHSFIAINPITGAMEQRFLYDLENEMTALRNKYLKPQGASKYQIDVESHKEGGIISMQTGGNFDAMTYLQSLSDADYKKRASEKGVEERVLRESERTPMGKETVINNSEFTGNDLVQLATMGVNLGSMFLDPLSGAAVGVGTSTVDFFNDINRDGFQGKDAWNYVKNLGMDALGVLPVIGDTFGTLGKVKKGLFQLAPKVIGYLGMALGIANSPQIIDSFTKILDERDMTTADWQNIASGINLIVSGTRMGKHAIKDARAKKAALQQDQLQVEVTDKAGNSKLLVLDGDNAKAVRESDHSVEAVDKIVKNIEGMLDYTVNPKSGLFDFSLRMPGKKVKNETTGAEERSWNPFEAKTLKANVQSVYDPVAYARAYHGKPNSVFKNGYALSDKAILNKYGNGDKSAVGKLNLDLFKTAQQGSVDNYIKNLRTLAEAYGKKTAKHKEHLTSTESKIKTTETDIKNTNNLFTALERIKNSQTLKANDIEAQRAGTGRKDALLAIKNARAEISRLEAEKAAIKGKGKKRKIEAKNKEIEAQDKIILQSTNYLKTNSKGELVRARKAADAANTEMSKLTVETAKLNDMLTRLNKHKSNLETRINTHSSAFNDLVNFKPRVAKFNDVDYSFGKKLDEAALLKDGLFKQGGSINRNKINKFLNYAKG